MKKNCKECGKEMNNKVYCSSSCQAKGVGKARKVERVEVFCLECKQPFKVRQNQVDNGKKYCSRDCKDKHQKKLYSNDGNPAYGKAKSKKWKKQASDRMKKQWKDDDYRARVSEGFQKYFNLHGHWPGTDEKANQKRKKTFMKKYGVDHNWKVKSIRKKCEQTTLERYGHSSFQLMLSAQTQTSTTSIENKISHCLTDLNIEFCKNHYVYYNNDKNYRIYDFYVPSLNLLIEADGDYWHGNPVFYSSFTEVQQINMANDEFKNELAEKNNFILKRYWEVDIKKKSFNKSLKKDLRKYGQKD